MVTCNNQTNGGHEMVSASRRRLSPGGDLGMPPDFVTTYTIFVVHTTVLRVSGHGHSLPMRWAGMATCGPGPQSRTHEIAGPMLRPAANADRLGRLSSAHIGKSFPSTNLASRPIAAGSNQVPAGCPWGQARTSSRPARLWGDAKRDAADAMRFSARGYHRVLRVARTLADLDGAAAVGRVHVARGAVLPGAGRRGAAGGMRANLVRPWRCAVTPCSGRATVQS